jgi:hypothetical protein
MEEAKPDRTPGDIGLGGVLVNSPMRVRTNSVNAEETPKAWHRSLAREKFKPRRAATVATSLEKYRICLTANQRFRRAPLNATW